MTLIKFTHANLKSTLYLQRDLIAGYYYSPANRCTHVVASGGAVFPALESVDEVSRLLTGQANGAATNKEVENGQQS